LTTISNYMKIFLSKINESWIVDRLKGEWSQFNAETVVNNIKKADIVWIISPWLWNEISKKYLKTKKVVCSIYHLEESDFTDKNIKEFKKRDQFVDVYHVISLLTKRELSRLTDKEIVYIPFWVNQNIWFQIDNKNELRKNFNIKDESFVVGSFQRDTQGSDLISPKLIKGPDRFIEIVKYLNEEKENLLILLSGKRRGYIINELEKANIDFLYFEMADFTTLNKLYNCLDLYIVSSRTEGGPQAIVECGITKTPIISTNVGFASEILSKESIFDMSNYKNSKPNIETAYENSLKLTIPKGFDEYLKMFKDLLE